MFVCWRFTQRERSGTRITRHIALGLMLLFQPSASLAALQRPASAAGSPPVATVPIRAATQAETRIPSKPLLHIDANGPCEFTNVVSVVIRGDGGLAVADKITNHVCLFDRNGQLIRTMGRKGGGPGEFSAILNMVALNGDSLLVFDHMLRRATVFAPFGQLNRTFKFQRRNGLPESPHAIIPLSDGQLLIGIIQPPENHRVPGIHAFEQELMVTSGDGIIQYDVRRIFAREHFTQVVPAKFGGLAFYDMAFGREGAVALFGDSAFLTGDGTSLRFQRFTGEGKLAVQYIGNEPRRAVTPREIAEYRRLASVERMDPLFEELRTSRIEKMPFPDSFPAYRRVISDGTRGAIRIWIEEYPTATATSRRSLLPSLRFRRVGTYLQRPD